MGTIKMTTLVRAVCDYAGRGWPVIALHNMTLYNGASVCTCRRRGECRAPAKHPRFAKWREIGTTDVGRLAAWWRAWPRANVGILMGGQAGLVCLDIDGDEGREALKVLEEANGPLPETLMQSTGREGGGVHHIFHIDPFYADWIKNRAKVAPGIDVRSEGGLIVAAPSIHPTGATYRWLNEGTPIAELPEWLFKVFISEKKRQTELSSSGARPSEERLTEMGWTLERRLAKARTVLEDMPPAIEGQNGSSACISAASAIVRGYCVPVEPHNHAFDLMWQVYNPRCQPPWADWELLHKVEDAELKVAIPWAYLIDRDDRDERRKVLAAWLDGSRRGAGGEGAEAKAQGRRSSAEAGGCPDRGPDRCPDRGLDRGPETDQTTGATRWASTSPTSRSRTASLSSPTSMGTPGVVAGETRAIGNGCLIARPAPPRPIPPSPPIARPPPSTTAPSSPSLPARQLPPEQLLPLLHSPVREMAEGGPRPHGQPPDRLAFLVALGAVYLDADYASVRELLLACPGGVHVQEAPDPDRAITDLYAAAWAARDREIANARIMIADAIRSDTAPTGRAQSRLSAYLRPIELPAQREHHFRVDLPVKLGARHAGELSGEFIEAHPAFEVGALPARQARQSVDEAWAGALVRVVLDERDGARKVRHILPLHAELAAATRGALGVCAGFKALVTPILMKE